MATMGAINCTYDLGQDKVFGSFDEFVNCSKKGEIWRSNIE